mmetsp:Transcript_30735/g.67111  ORF Transcript_30735/g.67111 Transcript_30735/m.67111 type:complete len:152 (-) Transcript_30735:135-590(-)
MGGYESKPETTDKPPPWGMLLRICLKDLPPRASSRFTIEYEQFEKLVRQVSLDKSAITRSRLIGPSIDPEIDALHMDLGEDLLELYPSLNRLRAEVVPSQMSEAAFWSNYFEALTVEMIRAFLRHPASAAYTDVALEALNKIAWDPKQLQP